MVRLRTGVVVLLAVLAAGCSGFAVGDPAPTVTPAPVPSATPTSPVAGAPSGVSVAETHRAVLSSTNYTVRTEWHVVGRDGDSRVRVRHVRRVGIDGTTYAGRYRSRTRDHPVYANNSRHVAYWTNRTTEAIHYVETDSDPRLYDRTGDGPVSDLTTAETIQRLVDGTNATVVDETPSDHTVLGSTRVDHGFTVRRSPYVANISALELRVVVSPTGVVERWRVAYDARLSSPFSEAASLPVTVVRSAVVTDVGSTTVDRPDWLPRSANDTAVPSRRRLPKGKV